VSGPLADWCAVHSKASPVGRAVLVQLALGCHHDGSNAYAPTWQELEHRTGYSRRAVAKGLREIEDLAEASPAARRGGGRGLATPTGSTSPSATRSAAARLAGSWPRSSQERVHQVHRFTLKRVHVTTERVHQVHPQRKQERAPAKPRPSGWRASPPAPRKTPRDPQNITVTGRQTRDRGCGGRKVPRGLDVPGPPCRPRTPRSARSAPLRNPTSTWTREQPTPRPPIPSPADPRQAGLERRRWPLRYCPGCTAAGSPDEEAAHAPVRRADPHRTARRPRPHHQAGPLLVPRQPVVHRPCWPLLAVLLGDLPVLPPTATAPPGGEHLRA
jgi:hypothetical protein